jgi:hypothetical protein
MIFPDLEENYGQERIPDAVADVDPGIGRKI